jgi:polyhydroxyalkanoate synthesis repressor PhaR
MAKETVTIKKYSNRRLYNQNESRYMKLDEIASTIRLGHDIKVIDSASSHDITKQILAQIILEEEKNQKDLLPISLLYQIIRANEEFTRDFFENYLNMTIESYLNYRKMMEQRLQKVEDINRLPFEMGDIFMKSFGFARSASPQPPAENKES